MNKDSSTICILIIAKNFDQNKIKFGDRMISISWLTYEIIAQWMNKTTDKKVKILIANEKTDTA